MNDESGVQYASSSNARVVLTALRQEIVHARETSASMFANLLQQVDGLIAIVDGPDILTPEVNTSDIAEETLKIELVDLNVSARTRGSLTRIAGLVTIRDLVECGYFTTHGLLNEIRNFGPTSLRELQTALAPYGIAIPGYAIWLAGGAKQYG